MFFFKPIWTEAMTTTLYSMITECPLGFILESEVEAEEGGWYGGRQEEALSIQKSNRI